MCTRTKRCLASCGGSLVPALALAALLGNPSRGWSANAGTPYDAGLAEVLGSFLGGSDGETVRAIALDAEGNAVIAGNTCSGDFPWRVDLRSASGGCDIFVAKVAANGARVIAATMLGGSAYVDDVSDVSLDAAGNVYLTGTTLSADFPVRNAIQPACASCTSGTASGDVFVVKLDPTASTIIWSTFLGGSDAETALALAIDAFERVWVLGRTSSADFPAVQALGGFSHVETTFIAQIDGAGTALTISSPLTAIRGRALATDAAGRALVAGTADSDVAVLAVSSDPASAETVVAFGGTDSEEPTDIAVGPTGDLYVVGITRSVDLATAGAFDRTPSGLGRGDAFVARVDMTTSSLAWASYLGSNLSFGEFRLAVTARGEPIVVGTGLGTDVPEVPTPLVAAGNLLRSRDGGRSYQRAASPPGTAAVTSFAFHPTDVNTIYVATTDGAFVTHDAGDHWLALGTVGTPYNYVGFIVVHPQEPQTLYAGGIQGLVRSLDGGASWAPLGGLGMRFLYSLAVDPSVPSLLYAGSSDGLYRSTDGGTTWAPASLGLPAGAAERVLVEPERPGHVWVQVGSQIYVSGNFGVSWVPRNDGMLPLIFDLAVAPSAPGTLYALANHAVLRTTNGGDHWELVNIPVPDTPAKVAVDPRDWRTIHVGGFFHFYRSTDGGRTLLPVRGVPSQAPVQAVGVSPIDPSLVVAGVPPNWDGFVAAISADGTRLLASSRLGGIASETTGDVAVGGVDDIWAVMTTASSDLQPANAVQWRLAGSWDAYVVRLATSADADGDGMPTAWELAMGLDPAADDADLDSDGDLVSNRNEYLSRSHPRGTVSTNLAEGATSDFFETDITLVNPDPLRDAAVALRFLGGGGLISSLQVHVPAGSARTLELNALEGLGAAAFSTIIESDLAIAAGRAMVWNPIGYGSHAQEAVNGPSPVWYFAEGATTAGFQLFYLLQNPNAIAADVTLTWLPADSRPPVVKVYRVAPWSRLTLWANTVPELVNLEAGLMATTADITPVVIERAMYLDSPSRAFEAGHVSAGAPATATRWYFAEGATGSYFDMFLLLANPNADDAEIEVQYLLPSGDAIVKGYRVGDRRRLSIWVDQEDPLLASTAVAATIRVTNGVPVVAERAMWWPGPTAATWHEAHAVLGLTDAGPRWVLADGEAGGTRQAETYVLLANVSDVAVVARVALLLESGATAESTVTIPPHARRNVSVAHQPWAVSAASVRTQLASGARFGVMVEALSPVDGELIVEGAVYHDAKRGAVSVDVWAAGRALAASRIP